VSERFPPVLLEHLEDGKRCLLHDTLSVTLRSGRVIIVPAGFITDGASIPRPFRSILSQYGAYLFSAVVHDYLYSVKIMSRKESDLAMLELMERQGIEYPERIAIYTAVRIGGWIRWNR